MRGVAIIESPGLQDITSGFRSGAALAEVLRLLCIPFRYQAIHTKELLKPMLIDTLRGFDAVHLSAHGLDGALAFTDGTYLHGDEMQLLLMSFAGGRIFALDACGSSNFEPQENLAVVMQHLTSGVLQPPKCMLTMYGNVTYGDSALTWGLFYRHLWNRLGNLDATKSSARVIRDCLQRVKNAGLHKICAAYWYDAYKKYVNVSPWMDETGASAAAVDNGEKLPTTDA